MAWTTTLVENLRYVINDLDASSYAWTNIQLQKFLAVASISVFSDLARSQTTIYGPYTVDISVPSISPDPTTNGAPGGLLNLITFKAACIIARAEYKKLGATAGWKIVDDRSTIDGSRAMDGSESAAKSFCDEYMEMLQNFKLGIGWVGHCVISPYSSSDYSPFGESAR